MIKITIMIPYGMPVISDTEIMGGAPVFRGTRVPVQTLLDYLEAGDSIGDFLKGFPSVSHKAVIAVLEEMKSTALERDRSLVRPGGCPGCG